MAFTGLREAGLTKARIEALTDGIFATVMTVLVLGLRPPTIDLNTPGASLSSELFKLAPNILTYALSFITLGLYWVGHHNQFHFVRRTDRTLLWINIVFLMSIGFVPFTTSLLGAYPGDPAAVRAYGANLVANGVGLYGTWWYATSSRRLVDRDLASSTVALVKRRILVGPAVFSTGIAVSFVSPLASTIIFFLPIFYYILPGHIDVHIRGEHGHEEK